MERKSYGTPSKLKSSPSPCPRCGSKVIWKDGVRRLSNGNKIQRFICRSCGYRFSESTDSKSVKNSGQRINRPSTLKFNRQVCATLAVGAKNLAEVESRREAGLRGATNDLQSLLFNYAWWLKKEGYAESTIVTRVKLLKILAKRGANLLDPESVKETIARQEWCNKRKVNAADAYTAFLRMNGGTWDPPKYRVVEKLPFIPTEGELDALIAGCGTKTSTFLRLLKETAARAGEMASTEMDGVKTLQKEEMS